MSNTVIHWVKWFVAGTVASSTKYFTDKATAYAFMKKLREAAALIGLSGVVIDMNEIQIENKDGE